MAAWISQSILGSQALCWYMKWNFILTTVFYCRIIIYSSFGTIFWDISFSIINTQSICLQFENLKFSYMCFRHPGVKVTMIWPFLVCMCPCAASLCTHLWRPKVDTGREGISDLTCISRKPSGQQAPGTCLCLGPLITGVINVWHHHRHLRG